MELSKGGFIAKVQCAEVRGGALRGFVILIENKPWNFITLVVNILLDFWPKIRWTVSDELNNNSRKLVTHEYDNTHIRLPR